MTPIMSQTLRQYKDHAIQYAKWCRDAHGCRHMVDCLPYVQEYIDVLVEGGLSPSTIHTYVAGICRVWEQPMDTYTLPRRVTADYTRSRGCKPVDNRKDAQRDASPRLYDFAQLVGVRRHEYAALRRNDIGTDAVGMYVLIRRGKGGKRQKQRVLPWDEDAVRAYFDGNDSYLFTKAELENKIDLHHLRALQAQKAYQYYLDNITHVDGYRDKLIAQIKYIWDADDCIRTDVHGRKPKKWTSRLITGTYWLRGPNRKLAQSLGRPVGYDRLAVLAVSVFCLSHWRHDVTVANYLLPAKPGDPDYFTTARTV